MTILINETDLVADFPAVAYPRAVSSITYAGKDNASRKAIKVQHGDVFGLPFESRSHGVQHHEFTFGSAVGYALQYHECPIESFNHAVKNNHPTHWANSNAVTLSSRKSDKRTVAALTWYDVILFEGRYFKLEETGNQNVGLVEIKD